MTLTKVFVIASVAAFGFFFGLIEAYELLELSWFSGINAASLKAILLIVSSVSIGAIAVALSAVGAGGLEIIPQEKATFEESLLETLSEASISKNYVEVIRIGEALSRPLFESGSFVTRLKIGKLVEEAAAGLERVDKQISALIDAVGWSLVELGKYDEAKRSIDHGMELSRETGNIFYEAKGLRHLGVISRRTGNFEESEKYYNLSIQKADDIKEEKDKEVMIACLNYALACLYYHALRFEDAQEYIEKSIICFKNLDDEYRLNMSMVTKGDIQFKLGLLDRSKDTYRKVLRVADRNTEKLQITRSCLGLAEVYLSDNRWQDAEKIVKQLDGVDLKDFKSESERRNLIIETLPKNSLQN